MNFVQRFPTAERREQPAQAQHMVQVRMGQEDSIERLKPMPPSQDLTLRAFAAIDQEALLSRQHCQGRQSAVNGGRGSRSAQEYKFKHQAPLSSEEVEGST